MRRILRATLCPLCSHAVDGDSIGWGESAGWCDHCQRVFLLPVFRVPGWVAGVIVILLTRLYVA